MAALLVAFSGFSGPLEHPFRVMVDIGLGVPQTDLQSNGPSGMSTCSFNGVQSNDTINYSVTNSGLDTIHSFTVVWQLNGNYDSLFWTGALPPGQSVTVTISGFSYLIPGTYQVDFWVKDVNGSADGNQQNDTTTTQLIILGQLTVNDLVDTLICPGDSVNLHMSGYNSYQWSTGGTNSSETFWAEGVYTVTVIDSNNCTAVDSFQLEFSSVPDNVLPSDTFVCPYGNVSIEAASGFLSYIWSTGDMGNNVVLPGAGVYSVTIVDTNGCTHTDDILLDSLPIPMITIPGVVDICQGDTAQIVVQGGALSYQWSNGTTGGVLETSVGGVYVVSATGDNGCYSVDTVEVVVHDEPVVEFLDTVICNDEPIQLATNQMFSEYQWSTGDTTSTITVSQPGQYAVTVIDEFGCTGEEVITINAYQVNVSLGPDTFLCSGDVILLGVGNNYVSYLWDNGSTSSGTVVGNGGVYWVEVTGGGGCKAIDTIIIDEVSIPVADFTEVVIAPQVNFTNQSNISTGILWNFGDGNSSTLENPVHTYQLSGQYLVSIEVSNQCGVDVFAKQVYVFPQGVFGRFKDARVSIYPTPADDVLYLFESGIDPGAYKVMVFSVTGKMVKIVPVTVTSGEHIFQLEVGTLASGTYLLKMVDSGNNPVFAEKFIHR